MSPTKNTSILRKLLREQTIDSLVKQGFSRLKAEIAVDKVDIMKKPDKKSKKLLKRISIDISVEDG